MGNGEAHATWGSILLKKLKLLLFYPLVADTYNFNDFLAWDCCMIRVMHAMEKKLS